MRRLELTGLTGIRFCAALFVYVSHVPMIPGTHALSGSSIFFNAGVVSVSFLFVLSGFILTYDYADLFGDGVSVAHYKRFVWDRLTKIYPVHLLTLVMLLPRMGCPRPSTPCGAESRVLGYAKGPLTHDV